MRWRASSSMSALSGSPATDPRPAAVHVKFGMAWRRRLRGRCRQSTSSLTHYLGGGLISSRIVSSLVSWACRSTFLLNKFRNLPWSGQRLDLQPLYQVATANIVGNLPEPRDPRRAVETVALVHRIPLLGVLAGTFVGLVFNFIGSNISPSGRSGRLPKQRLPGENTALPWRGHHQPVIRDVTHKPQIRHRPRSRPALFHPAKHRQADRHGYIGH